MQPQMRECVRRLFGQVAGKFNPRGLRHCFELLGLDFMIDEKGQVKGAVWAGRAAWEPATV